MITFKKKMLGSWMALPAVGLFLSLNVVADDAKPAPKKDNLDFSQLKGPEQCETPLHESEQDPDGEKFVNTLGEDGVRRVGVPKKFGVLEVVKKDSPEYYEQYYKSAEERAQQFAQAMLDAAKDQSEAGKAKLNAFLEKEPVFQITAHMDKILKSEFMKRAIYTADQSKMAGELVGKTVQELIDKLVEMDPKKVGTSRMKLRNAGRSLMKTKLVSGVAGMIGAREALARQVESMVTGETAVNALNNRLDFHIEKLNRNLQIFDEEDKYYREQAENCRYALAYSILSDNNLRETLKANTDETDPARALLIENVMLPLRRKIMGLRARLVQLDAVMAERVHHRKNYRRIIEESEEVRSVGILVIAGTISNHHATQDARAATAAIANARKVLNAMMTQHAKDFQAAMQEGREGQKAAILDFETVATTLRALKEEMKNEALHAADTVNALPEVARAIELTGMQLGELRNAMQKGADIAALIEERQIKSEDKDKLEQANSLGKQGWDFFKRAGAAVSTPAEKK